MVGEAACSQSTDVARGILRFPHALQHRRRHGVSRGFATPEHELEGRNGLQVLGTTEMPHINHRVGHQFHRIVPTLDALKPHQ